MALRIIISLLALTLLHGTPVNAQQQSRAEFLATLKPDLFAPCQDPDFIQCVHVTQGDCKAKVSSVIRQCEKVLPEVMKEADYNLNADRFAACFSAAISRALGLSEQELYNCSNESEAVPDNAGLPPEHISKQLQGLGTCVDGCIRTLEQCLVMARGRCAGNDADECSEACNAAYGSCLQSCGNPLSGQ